MSASPQKGEGAAALEAKKKELEARRAAAATKATKTFYKITVKVARLTSIKNQALCTRRPCMQQNAARMATSRMAGAVCYHSMCMLCMGRHLFAVATMLA